MPEGPQCYKQIGECGSAVLHTDWGVRVCSVTYRLGGEGLQCYIQIGVGGPLLVPSQENKGGQVERDSVRRTVNRKNSIRW